MARLTTAGAGWRALLGALLAGVFSTVGCAGNQGTTPPATDMAMCDTPACLNACNNDGDCRGGRRCDSDHHACVDCLQDGDCPTNSVCRADSHTCAAGCSATRRCTGNSALCEIDAGVCVECLGDKDCMDPARSRCLAPEGRCVPCLLAPAVSNCAAGQYCARVGSDFACLSGCADDGDCAPRGDGGLPDGGPAPRCDTRSHRCVDCSADSDCPASQICTNGECVEGCSQVHGCGNGLACCGAACTDVTSDVQNCGGCGMACKGGWLCCNSACFNPATDTMNCGGCGTVCKVVNGTPACVGRTCSVGGCSAGWADCNGVVRDGCETHTDVNPANCGGCGNFCQIPHASPRCGGGQCLIDNCNFGWADCNNMLDDGCETSTGADLKNCGVCGRACGAAHATPECVFGQCGIAGCDPGFADCNGASRDGCEVATSSDPLNCGGCNIVCGGANAMSACMGGVCKLACAMGFGNCDGLLANGCEANLTTDAGNCGMCGNACGGPHAQETCALGACRVTRCDFGFADCNGDPRDGCEVSTLDDPVDCGACRIVCSGNGILNPTCGIGLCNGTCAPGFADCNANKQTDGCETATQSDPVNCGRCGLVCPPIANGTPGCGMGVCGVGSCNAGFGDCDQAAGNGCEADLRSDANNCGACGHNCGGLNCQNGVCIACGAGSVTKMASGVVESVVLPMCVTKVTIEAWGAQGGANTGGKGARMRGDFNVMPGETLKVVVGLQGGGADNWNTGGGGGGSFVWRATDSTLPLVAAGGGGGGNLGYADGPGQPGGTGTNGTQGSDPRGAAGGVNGGGGFGNAPSGGGAGGTGWMSAGANSSGNNGCTGGQPFPSFAGGQAVPGGGAPANGGFGGGGGSYCGGGGGGGYSGGGGGEGSQECSGGGGGGSYNSGVNQSNSAGVQTGNGQVIISW